MALLNQISRRFDSAPFPGQQFPVKAATELSKQSIPDLFRLVPTPNPTFKALADLATQVNGAVLMGHSRGGRFPTEAALTDPAGFKALVLVEPGSCNAPSGPTYTDEQIHQRGSDCYALSRNSRGHVQEAA